MTTQEIAQYYSALLILQYVNKTKAKSHIEALVTPVIMDQLPLSVQNAFNIKTAIGVQLDTIGKYVGASRTGHGFNGQNINLSDSDYQILIQMAAVKNFSGSSLFNIQSLLHMFFPDEVFVFDYLNMRMGYFISSTVGSQDLMQMFVTQGMLPKPMGVILSSIIFSPIIDSFFGFRTYDAAAHNVTPFNNYDDYNMQSPWLTYDNALVLN